MNIYRLIMIGLLLTLPAYGATLQEFSEISNEVLTICTNKGHQCGVRLIQDLSPKAYTYYRDMTFSTGLVMYLSTDELRGVMYHELAHSVNKHSERGQELLDTLYAQGIQPTQSMARNYRHSIEYEADREATRMLKQNGKVNKLPEALIRLSSEKGYTLTTDTHPAPQTRVRILKGFILNEER